MPPLKLVFAGTPEFAARHLEALIASEHTLCGVYTQPDRPSGRGKKLSISAVKDLARQHNLPVFQPQSLKDEDAQEELRKLDCDLMVVVAYGLLLPKAVLDTPKSGCINVHGSILPKWRGAAPIQRAVEAGDTTTGVTVMQMDEGLDTGDMLLIERCPIDCHETSTDIYNRLSEIGPVALLNVVKQISENTTTPVKQKDELSSYARKIEKSEAEINWNTPAEMIDRKIRAFNPFPICFTKICEDRLRIHKAQVLTDTGESGKPGSVKLTDNRIVVQCGEGQLEILTLQLPGKKAMSASDFLNGFANLLQDDNKGAILGNPEKQ